MKTIREELKEIIVYEKMYCIKNKQRFGLRYYKKFVHELKKDEVKSENGILCAILTQLNKQTQRRITL